MSDRDTLARSLHDLGLATWFGGSLMGAVGLNGAAADAHEPSERLRHSALGWGRWAPVNTTAVATHLLGGLGLIQGNKGRPKVLQWATPVLTGMLVVLGAQQGEQQRPVAGLGSRLRE